VLSDPIFEGIRNAFGLKPKGPVVQTITILHSAILAVYSLWTFVNSSRETYAFVSQYGYWAMLCDHGNVFWDKHIGFWCTHFYFSKYYEFVDTWIVLLKGRKPIFLQTYHHAGVVICMWFMTVTKSCACVVMLVLNSFIHTIMYSYYVYAALGFSSPLKHYLTSAQLLQFFIGIGCTIPAYWNCQTSAQLFGLFIMQAYVVYLIKLFADFYRSSYGKKGAKKEE
jgi:hypothetical protein